MADGGCEAVCMEVSSIGLKMSRVYGVEFYAGIFTNLSPDHIGGNEHKTFEEYAYWKKQLYVHSGFTVANRDDAFFDDVAAAVKRRGDKLRARRKVRLLCREYKSSAPPGLPRNRIRLQEQV